jgi:hypothetical protein
MSLNDILQVGAADQQDLYSIVLRFRTHQVCFTADIAKMYHQIMVHLQDRDLQRILWRYSSEEPIQEYRLITVTYGTSSAPFLTTYCLMKQQNPQRVQNVKCWLLQHLSLILLDYWVQLSLPTKYFYKNCGKTDYNGTNYFLPVYNKNGSSCYRLFENHHNSRLTERLFAPMQPTSKSMDSATAVNECM